MGTVITTEPTSFKPPYFSKRQPLLLEFLQPESTNLKSRNSHARPVTAGKLPSHPPDALHHTRTRWSPPTPAAIPPEGQGAPPTHCSLTNEFMKQSRESCKMCGLAWLWFGTTPNIFEYQFALFINYGQYLRKDRQEVSRFVEITLVVMLRNRN